MGKGGGKEGLGFIEGGGVHVVSGERPGNVRWDCKVDQKRNRECLLRRG